MSELIGIHGKKQSGKDTTFSYIHEWAEKKGLRAARRGFADTMKLQLARMFIPDISIQEAVVWWDELKDGGSNSRLRLEWSRGDGHNSSTKIEHSISGGVALQRAGTEAGRYVHGEDVWVDLLLPMPPMADFRPTEEYDKSSWVQNFIGPFDFATMYDQPPSFCVIPDLRFNNEAQRIRDLGGINIEVVRNDQPQTIGRPDDHASEDGIDPDLIDRRFDQHVGLTEFRDHIFYWLDSTYADKVDDMRDAVGVDR